MTNADYITINENGVFVGGKPATKYRGVNIYNIPYTVKYFQTAKQKIKQERGLDLLELHALSSETDGGEYATPGHPSPKHGRYAWCRAKLSDGTELPWVFSFGDDAADFCAYYCAFRCANCVAANPGFRGAVFRSAGVSDSRSAQNANSQSPKPGDIIEQSFGNQIMKLKVIEITQKQH